MLRSLRMYGRYTVALPGYVRKRLSLADAHHLLRVALDRREDTFLDVLRRGVFDRPNPYQLLMESAGIGFGDVQSLVRSEGVEGTLALLRDAGVYVSLDEFKGRRPLRRGSFELHVTHEDFDNPLSVAHFDGRTGGSGGIHRKCFVDLSLITQDAIAHAIFAEAHTVSGRPIAIWRPGPPDVSGLANLLRAAKCGASIERWFVQRKHSARGASLKYYAFTELTRWVSRAAGVAIPGLEYTPLEQAARVAQWLAEKKRTGTLGYLDSLVSSAVRVCAAARETGLDIAGSFIRVGSEPLTAARAEIMRSVGCTVSCHYAMNEIGVAGMGCARADSPDDVHLLSHKLAILPVLQTPARGGPAVHALYLTSVSPASPKLLLNVESGDYANVQHRACGCALGEAGFSTHLEDVRSYEKLTSEGMTFHGSDLLTIVDEVLPRVFGGLPTDYQFVEREEDGLPTVSILVSPAIGPVDADRLVSVVLERLATGSAGAQLMADIWRQGRTLRVERREPIATGARKVLPLHVEHAS